MRVKCQNEKRKREREGETEKGLAARKRERLIAGEVDNESTRERKVWEKSKHSVKNEVRQILAFPLLCSDESQCIFYDKWLHSGRYSSLWDHVNSNIQYTNS